MTSDPTPTTPAAARTGRVLAAFGVVALVLVFVLPPLGLALGVIVLVRAIRLMRATAPAPQELRTPDGLPVTVRMPQPGRAAAVLALVTGVAATVLGALVLVLLVTFWTELRDYTECHDAANTTQGEQHCRDQLQDAIFDRFGLTR